MKGEKGICQFFDNGGFVIKTKFETSLDAENKMAVLKNIGTLIPGSTTYQCKECDFWHFGRPEQKDKYSK